MFVKNVVDVAVEITTAKVVHNGAELYSGAIKSIPFYLQDEKILTIGIQSSYLVMTI